MSASRRRHGPRTLQCVAPSTEFEEFCIALAERVLESEIAIAPAVEAAVSAMADIGLDPFSYYVPPEQVGSFRQNGIVGGVGLLLDATDAVGSKCARISETCPLEIVFVVEDNPGAEAGLLAGDVVVAVDGEPTSGQGFAATAGVIAADETGQVEITVLRDGETLVFVIERSELTVPTVIVDLPVSDVGYLRIPDFEDDIPGLVEDALLSLADFSPRTIVIDLRDNPGGFIDADIDVASMFHQRWVGDDIVRPRRIPRVSGDRRWCSHRGAAHRRGEQRNCLSRGNLGRGPPRPTRGSHRRHIHVW